MDNLRQVYNDVAGYYVGVRSLWPEMKKWVEDVKTKDRVLDVGCGEGRLLQGLGSKVDYTGIDFSKKLLEIARMRYRGKNREFITGDITKDDTWKGLGKFDKIFAVALLHHLPSKKEQAYVLRKMKEHLSPSGTIYVSFWNLWQKRFWSEHLRSLRLKLKSLPESFWWVEIPFARTKLKRFYFAGTKRYWEGLLAEFGWKDVKIKFDESKKNMWAILS